MTVWLTQTRKLGFYPTVWQFCGIYPCPGVPLNGMTMSLHFCTISQKGLNRSITLVRYVSHDHIIHRYHQFCCINCTGTSCSYTTRFLVQEIITKVTLSCSCLYRRTQKVFVLQHSASRCMRAIDERTSAEEKCFIFRNYLQTRAVSATDEQWTFRHVSDEAHRRNLLRGTRYFLEVSRWRSLCQFSVIVVARHGCRRRRLRRCDPVPPSRRRPGLRNRVRRRSQSSSPAERRPAAGQNRGDRSSAWQPAVYRVVRGCALRRRRHDRLRRPSDGQHQQGTYVAVEHALMFLLWLSTMKVDQVCHTVWLRNKTCTLNEMHLVYYTGTLIYWVNIGL